MPAQTKEAQRLCNLQPGSPEYRAHLGEVQEELREQSEAFEQLLCEEAGISREALQALCRQFTVGAVCSAIHQYGPGFQAHLGSEDGGNNAAAGGWLRQWELDHDQ